MIYTTLTGKSKQTYEGFKAAYASDNKHGDVLAIVVFDGTAEFWRMDYKKLHLAIEELKRYYRSEWQHDAEVVLYELDRKI